MFTESERRSIIDGVRKLLCDLKCPDVADDAGFTLSVDGKSWGQRETISSNKRQTDGNPWNLHYERYVKGM